MNELRRTWPDEIARIRAVVDRTPLPDVVTGYDVELGEAYGEPAVWIIYQTGGTRPRTLAELWARSQTLHALTQSVKSDLLDLVEGLEPYHRFREADHSETARS